MNRKWVFISAISLLLFSFTLENDSTQGEKNNSSFVSSTFKEVPLKDIKPKGWLLDQLQIMRNGSTGHLDEVYDRVKNDNGWLGGKGDSWEETPYWLDGAVALAYQLDDAVLKAKVLKYINWTLNHQRPSGYFGAITRAERDSGIVITALNAGKGDDWWPKMVMLKVLKQYYSATGDQRVIDFMTKYFNYQLEAIRKTPLKTWTEWAESRGAENILTAQWLYTITKDPSLLELADILDKQSYDWNNLFGSRNWVINATAYQNENNWMNRHGVNVAMALKAPALNFQRTRDSSFLKNLETGFDDLMTLHGLPMGIFSADEDLHGNNPTQGSELCTIVESMYSLEEIIAITGNTKYMDALERMTFNALPTQTTDDYNNKQYFQIANQVEIAPGVFEFSLPFDRKMNNVLGMKSGYTCCLANMHQGWTKYTHHLWYKTKENGLAALVYGPNTITTPVGASNDLITINEITDYPFNDEITFEILSKKEISFPFQLRVPGWCKRASININGKEMQSANAGTLITLNHKWKNHDKITLKLPMEVNTSNWGRNSRAIERGPLVYALKLGERWEKGFDKDEGEYFSVYPKHDWNYGLLEKIVKSPSTNLTIKNIPMKGKFIWNQEHAPIEIIASGKKIINWKLTDGVAYQPISDRYGVYKGAVTDSVYNFSLIPYGFTKVRIVAFPVVR